MIVQTRRYLLGRVSAALACSCANFDAAAAETEGFYICPPCGCAMDGRLFQEPGACPACGMALIARPASTAPGAGGAIEGHWVGQMTRSNQPLNVAFNFATISGALQGDYGAPAQQVLEWPLDSVAIAGEQIEFVLGGSTTFRAAVRANDMRGAFSGDGGHGEFALTRHIPAPPPYNRTDVVITNGGVSLAGTLLAPHSAQASAAIVLLHGSGPQPRWGTLLAIADQFARAGIAAFAFDKRGCGGSSGDWETASYEDLAGDALACVDFLASRPDIDSARIGLLGHSEGGIVAPVAAARAPEKIAFVIAEDTVAGLPRDQDVHRVETALASEPAFSAAERAEAARLYRLFIDVARGARPYSALQAASAPYLSTHWYAWLAIPPRDNWIWSWYPKVADFDTLDAWRGVRAPVLIVYGERDAIAPVDRSISKIETVLAATGVSHSAIIVPNAAHNLTISPRPGEPFFWTHAAPGLTEILVSWAAEIVRR